MYYTEHTLAPGMVVISSRRCPKTKCTWCTVLGSNLNSACCKASSRKRFAQLQEQIEPSCDIQCMDQWQHLGLRHLAPGRESRLAPSQGGNQDELARLDVVRSTAGPQARTMRAVLALPVVVLSSWRDLASALLLNRWCLGQPGTSGLIHLHQTELCPPPARMSCWSQPAILVPREWDTVE